MKARVKWVEGMSFVGESASGHAIVLDGPPDLGGRNLGMRPMEALLIAIGSCSSVDVVHILKKARQNVTSCHAELSSERAETDPKVFTSIHLHFVVEGKDLSENHVKRAVELSADKYCSASIMAARGGCKVTHSYELRQAS